MRKRKQLSCEVRAFVPAGMSAAHFRRLIRDGVREIYLSIHDQIVADTNTGIIKPKVSAARRITP